MLSTSCMFENQKSGTFHGLAFSSFCCCWLIWSLIGSSIMGVGSHSLDRTLWKLSDISGSFYQLVTDYYVLHQLNWIFRIVEVKTFSYIKTWFLVRQHVWQEKHWETHPVHSKWPVQQTASNRGHAQACYRAQEEDGTVEERTEKQEEIGRMEDCMIA